MLDSFFFFPVVSIACEDDDEDALTLALAAVRSPPCQFVFLVSAQRSTAGSADRRDGVSNSEGTHSCPG